MKWAAVVIVVVLAAVFQWTWTVRVWPRRLRRAERPEPRGAEPGHERRAA